ncbi:hypothetical protein ACWCPS_35885 [Streptomyces mauvecolor]
MWVETAGVALLTGTFGAALAVRVRFCDYLVASAVAGALLGVIGGGTACFLTTKAGQHLPSGGAGASRVESVTAVGLVAAAVVYAVAMSITGIRFRRRILAMAEGFEERCRTIWSPLADRIAAQEVLMGDPIPDAVRQHFTGAREALDKKDGHLALAQLRHGTVRMAIALRPLARANPDDVALAQALASTLAVRDQVVTQVAEHRVALM